MTTTPASPFLDPTAARQDELAHLDAAAQDLAAEFATTQHTTTREAAEEIAYALRSELYAAQLDRNESQERTLLDVAAQLRMLAAELTKQMHYVGARARAAGATWSAVGQATGVSLQRAQQRYRGL